MKIPAEKLQVGDKIMPPERELRLWMRRSATERNLLQSALKLTIAEIHEGNPDKNGRWLIFSCDQTAGDSKRSRFAFKARPETLWTIA